MKIFENNILRYESPNEGISVDDSNSMMYDLDIFNAMLNLVPENFRQLNDYILTFSRLSAYITTKEISIMEDVNNIYNPDLGSDIVLNFLADRYDIVFPINYGSDKKRLILKYFPNFIKIKGTEFAIKLLDFIDRTESDFYNSNPGKYEIEQYYEGLIKIKIIEDSDKERIKRYKTFAQTLINRITPAGMYSQIIIE